MRQYSLIILKNPHILKSVKDFFYQHLMPDGFEKIMICDSVDLDNAMGKIITKKGSINQKNNKSKSFNFKKVRRGKFKSLVIEKDFEPENPKQLEELDENSCKWPIGHPNEENFYFCGRTSLKDFSYCKLHLLYAFQPKNRKEDILDKDDKDKDNEVPKFIKRKIKSA